MQDCGTNEGDEGVRGTGMVGCVAGLLWDLGGVPIIKSMSKTVEPHVLKEYAIVRQMGSGAYGHVWEVKEKSSNKSMALKKVFDAFRNSIDAQRTYREVEVLHRLHHDNIIKLFKVIKSKNKKDLYLVFEFMEADLHSVVGTNILEKMHQIFIFYQILRALHYIHSAELIHRDLKPSNILINSECRAKVCDFGLIRSLASKEETEEVVLSEEVATKWYRAPELLLGSRSYHKPVDMWSFGCIVAEILTGKPLFNGSSTLNQFEKILEFSGNVSKGDLESLDSPVAEQLMSQIKCKPRSFRDYFAGVDQDFYQLLEGTLSFNPYKRLTAQQALNLPLFKQFGDQLTCASEPIIPTIDDNVRLNTKAYREKIYDDIDLRYASAPLKNRINELRCYSVPKMEKDRSSSKKRPLSTKKTSKSTYEYKSNSTHDNRPPSVKKSNSSSVSSLKKNSLGNNPYFKSIVKYTSAENLAALHRKMEAPRVKRDPSQTSKLIKRGARQKLQEIEKRNILGSIGVERPKKLRKYLK